MNVNDARTLFAARAHMLRTVQFNFKHKPEFMDNDHKCKCKEDDMQEHLATCGAYAHLREGLEIEKSDKDLVIYFQRVIRERETEARFHETFRVILIKKGRTNWNGGFHQQLKAW